MMKQPLILPRNVKPSGISKADIGLMNRDDVLIVVDSNGNETAATGAGTALEITTALQGVVADPERIGVEFMPATIALTSDIPTDYEITSAQGRRLIDSFKAAYPATTGTVYFATTKATAGNIYIYTTTGYAALISASGAVGGKSPSSGGESGTQITLSQPAAGGHRAYGVVSVNSSGVASGEITRIYVTSNQLTAIDVSSATSLLSIDLNTNQLTTFSGAGLSALTTLDLGNNQLAEFSGAGMSAVTHLDLNSNQLTTFSGTGLSALTSLYLYDNQLTAFSGVGLSALTSLDLNTNQLTTFSGTGLSALIALDLNTNQLTEFSATGMSALTTLYIQNNNLTSILATGLNLSYNVYGMYGSDIGDNDLSLEALQAFVDSLAVTTTGVIEYAGNPGATAFAAWLTPANDKDYIWSNT